MVALITDLPKGKFKEGERELLVDWMESKGLHVIAYHIDHALCIHVTNHHSEFMEYVIDGYTQESMYTDRFSRAKPELVISFAGIVKPKTLQEVLYGS